MFSYIYLCKYVVFLFKQVNSYLTYCYITCFLHLTNILEIFIFPQICLIHFNGHKGYGCAQYIYIYIYFLNINLFIYFWLRWVFVAVRRLSVLAASGGYSSLQCAGFSLRWLLLLRSTGSRSAGFSSCGTRA